MSARAPLIFLIAGEVSGDLLGGRLMASLRSREPRITFAGVGGERMAEQGLESLFPMSDLAVMGLAEVLPRLPLLLGRMGEAAAAIRRLRPDAVVTIDAPDFAFRVAKRVRGLGIPLIHYVAPTVWAWRPGRARKIARFLDHLLALLPFEPPYFEREGLPCTFVGHPVVEGGAGRGHAARFRAAHGLPEGAPLLCVLPGSRRGEVERLLPVFEAALGRLVPRHPGLRAVVPTVGPVRDRVARAIGDWPVPTVLVEGEEAKFDAMAASTAALAASGTVALELALAGVPAVIAYRMAPLTMALARRLVRVRYVNLVNLMLDRGLVPELLQEDCTPERIEAELERLLIDPEARRAQTEGAAEVARWLGREGQPPADRAAEAVLAAMRRGPRFPARNA
nr:lipid-A-disaccharide synthase [Arenibaculum pallidiluteum]